MDELLFENCVILEEGQLKKVKNYADTYLYNTAADTQKNIFNFLMTCKHIDKKAEYFEDIKYDIKHRQTSSYINTVLESDQVILCYGVKPLPKAFKVMAARDVRGDKNKLKIFIDVTELFVETSDNVFTCSNVKDISTLLGYLITAMNLKIYMSHNSDIVNRNSLTEYGAKCFSDLYYYIIDFLRISGGTNKSKEKVKYFAAMYYQVCLLQKDADSQSVRSKARKIAGISEQEEKMFELYVSDKSNPYQNIDTMIHLTSQILNCSSLTTESYVAKWMYLFGPGTYFGLELYPDFARILIDTYVGSYQNNQQTIEKVIGGRGISEFVNEIFKIGSELIK